MTASLRPSIAGGRRADTILGSYIHGAAAVESNRDGRAIHRNVENGPVA